MREWAEEALRGAALAYRAAREARLRAGSTGNAAAAAKALAGAVRDVVAWRCVRLSGADSEDVYIAALDNAFDGGLTGDKDLKSQLLNSFHHVLGGDPNAFIPNLQACLCLPCSLPVCCGTGVALCAAAVGRLLGFP